MLVSNKRMKAIHSRPNSKPLSSRDAWIFIAIVIFICVSCWQASIVQTSDFTDFNLGDYNLEFNIKTNDEINIDPITSYLKTMDLSVVPPEGSPPSLPAERATGEEQDTIDAIRKRNKYGGGKDKAHLGGFTALDPDGISPYAWREMMEYFGVKSLLDVGCGRGISTSWFFMQGVHVQCVEGSRDAIEQSVLPALVNANADNVNTNVNAKEKDNGNQTSNATDIAIRNNGKITEHDFSRGPWWPEKTVDAVWCVELLEHVGRNFAANYLTAFKKSALIFASHSNWGGWHHTEVHDDSWWISKFKLHGFVYSHELTERIRKAARKEREELIPLPVGEKTYGASHITGTMMVSYFIHVYHCIIIRILINE